jgi:hypothetical protein
MQGQTRSALGSAHHTVPWPGAFETRGEGNDLPPRSSLSSRSRGPPRLQPPSPRRGSGPGPPSRRPGALRGVAAPGAHRPQPAPDLPGALIGTSAWDPSASSTPSTYQRRPSMRRAGPCAVGSGTPTPCSSRPTVPLSRLARPSQLCQAESLPLGHNCTSQRQLLKPSKPRAAAHRAVHRFQTIAFHRQERPGTSIRCIRQ